MRWWKVVLLLVVVVALVALAGVGVYQWVRPGEWASAAAGPYPSPESTSPGVVAELPAIPLIVDGRLRVFATKHDVWAEPLTAPAGSKPFWSYHRFPATVTGVVVASAHRQQSPVVAVKWSTGSLIGIDARTGRVAWRRTVEKHLGGDHWIGGPTGVAMLYGDSLLGLFTAQNAQAEPVIISAGERSIEAFRPATGQSLWRIEPSGCTGVSWTGRRVVAVVVACDQPKTIHLYDTGTGREVGTWRPGANTTASQSSWIVVWRVGCRVALSECAGFVVSDDGGAWLLDGEGHVVAVSDPGWGSVLVEQAIVRVGDDRRAIRAASVDDGRELWQWPSSEEIVDLAADEQGVYAITRTDQLLRLDPRSGNLISSIALPPGAHDSFHVYASGGYVIVDRSNFDFTDRNAAWSLPRGARPVLLVATGR
ncbi:PQQ-like domain-containing protein [Micromonospora rhizosphaerae]|uniref:PQQ-like domain-containing protein n=1 Tax=Micromonospora rhizosphaerae TaxID=568872 RepID=A0A1C6SZA5_9ACTN|nr:PQQ-binding-like beta-propeller repeat protein [Micromonospora rhizosphaerae]SCL34867.1 PQQ-like domain-containing protein [Micromonospora rhizosphaerae]